MRMKLHIVLMSCILLAVMSSCQHKELCYDHSHVREVDVIFDWSKAPEADPESMSLYLYPVEGGRPLRYEFSDFKGGKIRISDGTYHAICMNSDITNVVTNNNHDFNSFEISTKDISMLYGLYGVLTKSIPRASKTENERIAASPEIIWSSCSREILIDPSNKSFSLSPVCNVLHCFLTMTNVANLKWVKGISGTLSSMAGGYQPQFEALTQERVTLAFNCSYSIEENKVIGDLSTFGCCPSGKDVQHTLTIYVELYDDSKWYYQFDVTDQIHNRENPYNIVINIDNLPVPQPVVDGGGFAPEVDEWQEIIYNIKM